MSHKKQKSHMSTESTPHTKRNEKLSISDGIKVVQSIFAMHGKEGNFPDRTQPA